jgi:hypothetical protein
MNLTDENIFSISPNPANDILIVKTETLNKPITIFDTSGRVILDITSTSEQNEIDVSALTNGMYFLQLNNKTLIFIIQHNGL